MWELPPLDCNTNAIIVLMFTSSVVCIEKLLRFVRMEPILQPTKDPSYSRCHAPHCQNNAKDNYNLSFFRFPKLLNRYACPLLNIRDIATKIFAFAASREQMFANDFKSRPKNFAIPTLFTAVVVVEGTPFEERTSTEQIGN
ncbi:hypothetical protein Trydic_g16940 [Trypoxylus dichotomus]